MDVPHPINQGDGRSSVQSVLPQPLGTTDVGSQSHPSAEPPLSDDITTMWGKLSLVLQHLGK